MSQSRFLVKDFAALNLNNAPVAVTGGELTVNGTPVSGGGGVSFVGQEASVQYTIPYFDTTDGSQIGNSGLILTGYDDNSTIRTPNSVASLFLSTSQTVLSNNNSVNSELLLKSDRAQMLCAGYYYYIGSDGSHIASGNSIDLSSNGVIYLAGTSIDMQNNPVIHVPTPTNSTDAANKAYVDANLDGQVTITLTPSQVQNLSSSPVLLITNGTVDTGIIVTKLEFFLQFNTTPYSATGVSLYVDWPGNYVNSSGPNAWLVPCDDNSSNLPLLTGNVSTHAFSINNTKYQGYPIGGDVYLKATGAITAGDSTLKIRATYKRTTAL